MSDKNLGKKLFMIKISVLTGLFLAVTKFSVGFFSHSMAVLASGLDSAMDVGVSLVNLFAAKQANKPPDEEHTYGHGKIESLAGLFQSQLIGISGIWLIIESVRRFTLGARLQHVPLGVAVMIFSIVVTGLLISGLRKAARRNPSLILQSETLHFTTDLLSNGGVILALLIVRLTGQVIWDLIVSILIAGYILKASWHILKSSIDELLDRSLSPSDIRNIQKIIFEHDSSIVGLHHFRSRMVGGKIFLDFHIEIQDERDFKRAHTLTEDLVASIQQCHPGADVTIHFDPEGED